MDVTAFGLSRPDDLKLAEYGLIGAVAQWCECLQGKSPVIRSLQLLGLGLEADAVALVRYAKGARMDGQPITWDRAPADIRGGRLDHGFARALLGPYFEAARPGSLWFRSMMDGVSRELGEFHTLRCMREMVAIPIDSNDRHIDVIEFHFSDRLRNSQQHLLNTLAPVLSSTWRNRAHGLFTEAVLQRAVPRRDTSRHAAILSPENPSRLSRAEYRVALMLSRGMTVERVKATLGIQESTLRTHLGNLYAKTGTAGLSELVYLLVSSTAQGVPDGTKARIA